MWEWETWRGADLTECCCVATAMGEWGQAGDESREGGDEEGGGMGRERRKGWM